eukprot:1261836-Pyramimonas_sp.AAC.1
MSDQPLLDELDPVVSPWDHNQAAAPQWQLVIIKNMLGLDSAVSPMRESVAGENVNASNTCFWTAIDGHCVIAVQKSPH